jgi:hypothetical protein
LGEGGDGSQKFQHEKIKKKTILDIYIKNLKKIPKKPFEKVVVHLKMLHLCEILHKRKLQNLKTMFFFLSILCCKDVSGKHPKSDL